MSFSIFYCTTRNGKNTRQQHLDVIRKKHGLHYVPLPVRIYIFNVIRDGDDKSKAAADTLVALYAPIHVDDLYRSRTLVGSHVALCHAVSAERGEVLRLIISLREMLTSPSCRVLGDRRRRTRPEWRSQWQAHRSKTRKCQTPSARQRFLCERHVCHSYTSRAITNMNQNSVSNGQLNNSHSARLEFSGKLMLLLFFFFSTAGHLTQKKKIIKINKINEEPLFNTGTKKKSNSPPIHSCL